MLYFGFYFFLSLVCSMGYIKQVGRQVGRLGLGGRFLLGDFNAHHPFWNCTRPNDYGNAIYDILLHSNADIIFPDSPTHFTHLSSSTIDFGLFNGFNFDKNIQSVSELSSDHNPILIKLQIRLPPEPPKIINKINWTQFHHLVNELPPPPPRSTALMKLTSW